MWLGDGFIQVFLVEVALELSLGGQIGINGENGEMVGKNIPYHEKSKCKGPVAGRHEVSQEAGRKWTCLSTERKGVGDGVR